MYIGSIHTISQERSKYMNIKITGFADEIAPDLITQVASVKSLGISHIEMGGGEGANLIYPTYPKGIGSQKLSEGEWYLPFCPGLSPGKNRNH